MELTRWFIGVGFLSGREDEPNQPRHQPIEAPTISRTTRTPTNASFKASRKARRAIKRNSATATKAITPVVIAIVISALLLTACCFLVFRAHGRLDVSADIKVAFNLHADRIAGLHKVFKNQVDYVLVKNLHRAKRIDI